MKTSNYLTCLCLSLLVWGCKNDGEYVDLNSGKGVAIEKDPETGYMINTETKKPVYLYVDTRTKDTLYGRTGKVVNRKIVRSAAANNDDYNFVYEGDDDYIYEDGEYKQKHDDDGAMKIKDGDYKKKFDSDGDVKIKDGDYKNKVESDGDVKIKNGDTKIKIEDGKKKVKKDD